ncbi:hypothetical protein Anas_04452 [Armadillidium nasatum]|uniref:Phosphoinositide phospholipase C beta 1-4-like EF-hand domain-containing protein n=1 Tax=Armadillidium nasatum TaxID=96803 RepID=A0A5N5SPZ5_9CRUS|nr:hypothetical protein Anas_04452 [Armadillidium nasatum]
MSYDLFEETTLIDCFHRLAKDAASVVRVLVTGVVIMLVILVYLGHQYVYKFFFLCEVELLFTVLYCSSFQLEPQFIHHMLVRNMIVGIVADSFSLLYEHEYGILSWMRLGMTVDVLGKISVKNIVRTFASGKTERIVYQTLADMGLPSEKMLYQDENIPEIPSRNLLPDILISSLLKISSCFHGDSIEPELFTFEKFYQLYHTICPRTDIDDLFNSMYVLV